MKQNYAFLIYLTTPVLVALILQCHPPVVNKHKYDHQMKPQKSCQGYEDTTEHQSTIEQWMVIHTQSNKDTVHCVNYELLAYE